MANNCNWQLKKWSYHYAFSNIKGCPTCISDHRAAISRTYVCTDVCGFFSLFKKEGTLHTKKVYNKKKLCSKTTGKMSLTFAIYVSIFLNYTSSPSPNNYNMKKTSIDSKKNKSNEWMVNKVKRKRFNTRVVLNIIWVCMRYLLLTGTL